MGIGHGRYGKHFFVEKIRIFVKLPDQQSINTTNGKKDRVKFVEL